MYRLFRTTEGELVSLYLTRERHPRVVIDIHADGDPPDGREPDATIGILPADVPTLIAALAGMLHDAPAPADTTAH